MMFGMEDELQELRQKLAAAESRTAEVEVDLEKARGCIRAWIERRNADVDALQSSLAAEKKRVRAAYLDGFTAGANAIEEQDETEYPSDPDVAYAQSKYGEDGGS